MLLDIEYPVQKNIDETLWTHVHYKVIDEYRKRIVAVFLSYTALLTNSMKNSIIQHDPSSIASWLTITLVSSKRQPISTDSSSNDSSPTTTSSIFNP